MNRRACTARAEKDGRLARLGFAATGLATGTVNAFFVRRMQ
jgi:hypothetical protein